MTSQKNFAEKQFPVTESAIAIILANYNLAGFTFQLAAGGIENTTLIINCSSSKYALRIYRQGKKSYVHMTREAEFMNLLVAHKLPIPRVLKTSASQLVTQVHLGTSWEAIMMEYRPGTTVKRYTERLLSEMAHIQAKIHLLGVQFAKDRAITVNELTQLRSDFFVNQIDLNQVGSSLLRDFLERARSFVVDLDDNLPLGISHFDFTGQNILVTKRGKISAVLDFDDMIFGPLVVCLANSLWDILFSTNSQPKLAAYVKDYQLVRALSAQEIDALASIMLHRHYVTCSLQVVLYGRDKERDTQLYLHLEEIINKINLKNLIS